MYRQFTVPSWFVMPAAVQMELNQLAEPQHFPIVASDGSEKEGFTPVWLPLVNHIISEALVAAMCARTTVAVDEAMSYLCTLADRLQGSVKLIVNNALSNSMCIAINQHTAERLGKHFSDIFAGIIRAAVAHVNSLKADLEMNTRIAGLAV